MDDVAFEYRLTGAGFFDALFRVGDDQLAVEQLGDSPVPLEELMTAALALARRQDPPRMLWDPENGSEYRWYLSRNADRLHIRVAHVASGSPWQPAEDPSTLMAYDVECLVTTFCTVVLQRATEVLARYGQDRYQELSLRPFPLELLNSLAAACTPQ